MTFDELVARSRECGFADSELIRRLARGAVALRPQGPSGDRPRGSRFGGLPTLPPSAQWPQRDDRHLAFIAQMDLAAQPSIAVEQGLPPDGLLAFFYDAEQSTWGFDLTDAGSFAVVYLPDSSVASVVAEWPADVPEHARTGERAAEAGGRPTGPHGHS